MPITERQKVLRTRRIGGSDLAAICGFNPYRTPLEIWLEKTGRVAKTDVSQNSAAELGNEFEPTVVRWSEKRLGKLRRNVQRAVSGSYIVVNLDAITMASGEPVEAKTAGMVSGDTLAWGDEPTEVPPWVLFQAHGAMLATERAICHVPTYLNFRGFKMYRVEFSTDIAEAILVATKIFWEEYVLKDVPPYGFAEKIGVSPDLARRVLRIPNKIVPVEADLLTEYTDLTERMTMLDKAREEVKKRIFGELLDAELGDAGEHGHIAYREVTRKAYTVPESTYRKLTVSRKPIPENIRALCAETQLTERKVIEDGRTESVENAPGAGAEAGHVADGAVDPDPGTGV